MTRLRRETILVFGASGSVGREVVSQLGAAAVDVRGLTRDPESAAMPPEVETVRGDITDPASLESALAGVDAVFLLWPSFSAEGVDAVIDAIDRHVKRVVYLSAQAAVADPESVWAVIERRIAATELEWTFLRPTGFAKNTLGWADQIAAGVVTAPYGRAARSLIDERDMAAVAVRALTGTELEGFGIPAESFNGHGGETYVLSGPETVTQAEQVQIIGEAIGRRVLWQEQPRAEALSAIAAAFGSEAIAEGALDTWQGFETEPEIVTSTVQEVTGRRAHSFVEWAREHADEFR